VIFPDVMIRLARLYMTAALRATSVSYTFMTAWTAMTACTACTAMTAMTACTAMTVGTAAGRAMPLRRWRP
jgi:hypothetical protein